MTEGELGVPVGTICFAWSFQEGEDVTTFSETRKFDGDRNAIRRAGAEYAISRVWHYHNKILEQRKQ